MSYILFDSQVRFKLFPFTCTRPVADIRCGILTMRERWEKLLEQTTGSLTEPYLQDVFQRNKGNSVNIYMNGAVFGTSALASLVIDLTESQKNWKIVQNNVLIAFSTDALLEFGDIESVTQNLPEYDFTGSIMMLQHVWDIFTLADAAIRLDFELLTHGRKSAPIPDGVLVAGKENLFIEEGANISLGCIINATTGPIYLGKDAVLLEGVMIRGSFALGEHGVIKMGAKIYGATSLGPGCKVGGEISNVVMFANSNKGHDGYLGNAVIGEWCNLGADTNCSNLKNNYEVVKIWDQSNNRQVSTGLIFCGLIMGDHSKCGINTMFNTGTMVGVSCNIYGGDFPPKFIPSFSWGSSEKMITYQLDKAIDTANKMMGRRGVQLTDDEKEVFKYLFETSAGQRK